MQEKRSKGIKEFIIHNVETHPQDIALLVSEQFGITRQAVNKHLRTMVADKILSETGTTRSKRYKLFAEELLAKTLPIANNLSEDMVYTQEILPILKRLAATSSLEERCAYCFTEILNNAIDHSEGTEVRIEVICKVLSLEFWIMDDGMGIFRKIKEKRHLEDEREAILELSKGKLTTAPEHHSGQGIFFSSRISDRMIISSHRLTFLPGDKRDMQVEEREAIDGTCVVMQFDRNSTRTSKEVFDRYTASGEDYGFDVTHVPVKLAIVGEENLISRSQAKRLLAGLDKFKEVALDFTGVSTVGQAFADEIFRVFKIAHPNIDLMHFNANEEVTKMINRALYAKEQV